MAWWAPIVFAAKFFGGMYYVARGVGPYLAAKDKRHIRSRTYKNEVDYSDISREEPVPIVYGRCRVTGMQIYREITDLENDKYDAAYAFCEGEVESVTDIQLNGIPINDLAGCSATAYTGTSNQTGDAIFAKGLFRITAEADAYVVEDNPDVAYHPLYPNSLNVKKAGDLSERTLVRFDLSNLPPGLTVDSAKLVFLGQGRAVTGRVVAYTSQSEVWTDSTVTWNNQPTIGSACSDNPEFTKVGKEQVFKLNATGKSYLQTKYDAATTVTFFVKFYETVNGVYSSRESPYQSPYLEIKYSGGTPCGYRNTAYAAVTIDTSNEKIGGADPTVTALVQGRKIKNWTGSEYQTTYVRNPAWQAYDYLINSRYAAGIAEADIDGATFKTVASYCDAEITDDDGNTIPRYTSDLVIDGGPDGFEGLNMLLRTFAGYLYSCNGKICLGVEKTSATVRTKITIDHAVIDDTLTNFPVLVSLTASNFDFTKARSDGYDVKFYDGDNSTALSFERVSHDAVNEVAEYWVKIPSISATIDTVFYMRYGDPNATDSSNKTDVWDDNYVMVQHMNDTTISTITDSTQYANNGTKKDANEPIEAAGQIGKAQSFDGTDDYIQKADVASLTCPNAITMEAWVKPITSIDGLRVIVCKWNDENREYQMQTNAGKVWVYIQTSASKNAISAATLELNTTYYLVGVWDGANIQIYINAVADGNAVAQTGTISDTASRFTIGAQYWTSWIRTWYGLIDEVRISNIARSAAWRKAVYNAGTGTLLTYEDYDFTESNIIAGSFQFAEIDKAEAPNIVRAMFIDADNKYQKTIVQVEDEPDQDVRGPVIQDVDLLGVSSRNQAGRLAQMQLMKAKLCQYVCAFRVSIKHCAVAVGDLCTVTHSVPGWTAKPFRIVKLDEHQNDEIDLTLEEYNGAVFGDTGQGTTYIEYPSQPNPVTVRPPADIPEIHRIIFTASGGLTWTAGTIYYKGVGYEIDAGGTSDAYIYFDPDISDTELQTSAEQPTLGANGWLLAYYDSVGDTVDLPFTSKIINAKYIKALSITTAELNFVPLFSADGTGDIVATINASEEGITIDADNIAISGSTEFSAGYDPTEKLPTASAGAMAYEDLVTLAKLDETIIVGGYIKTGLVSADNIDTGTLVVARTEAKCTNALADQTSANIAAGIAGQGDLATLSVVELAKLGETVIEGGYIKTGLINADNIDTGTLTGRTVQTDTGEEDHYQRVIISGVDNNIKIYNSLNELICDIDDGAAGAGDGYFYLGERTGGVGEDGVSVKGGGGQGAIRINASANTDVFQIYGPKVGGERPANPSVQLFSNGYVNASTGFNLDGTTIINSSKAIVGVTGITVASGNIVLSGANATVDGRDVSADGSKLDGIAANATVGATWSVNITNQPDTFPPAAHEQSAATITSGTLPVARGGTGSTSFTIAQLLQCSPDTQTIISSGKTIDDFAAASHVGAGGDAHADVIAGGADGFMTGADKTKLDGIAPNAQPGTVTAVTGTSPVASSGGTTPAISMPAATNAAAGHATAAHITAIEANTAKVTNATHTGDVTGSGALTIANKVTMTATSPVVVSGSPTVIAAGAVAISMAAATAGNNGYMTSTYAGKLDNIAANATVGADWNSNLSNIPGTIVYDGDFTSDGFLRRSGGAGSYAVSAIGVTKSHTVLGGDGITIYSLQTTNGLVTYFDVAG